MNRKINTDNCNGLCNVCKMNCIFALCVERKYDIVRLQETFWNNDFIEKVKRDQTIWEGGIFYSNGENNRQGVTILIKTKFKMYFFKQKEKMVDTCILLLKVKQKINIWIFIIYMFQNSVNEMCIF